MARNTKDKRKNNRTKKTKIKDRKGKQKVKSIAPKTVKSVQRNNALNNMFFHRCGIDLLIEIERNPDSIKLRLARKLNICYSHVVVVVDKLIQYDLVTSFKKDRSVYLNTTSKGKKIVKYILSIIDILK